VDGADLEDTLVQFLDECLYRYESTGQLVVRATLKQVSPARAEGEVFVVDDPDASGPMIKAVTYHGLVVSRTANGWMTRVYLDV
jgi:SHS2 domain-containing protein